MSSVEQSAICVLHRERRSDGSRREALLIPLVLIGSAIFLYLQVFILPATPRIATGDQSIYLHSAARMYDGEMIYRDYDQLTLPGTDVLYLALFKIFGVRAWIPQLMLVAAGFVSTWLAIVIAAKVVGGPTVFLPGLLFLTLPYASYLDATHHLYNVLAAMGALAVLIEERTPIRLAWAGLLWGVGTCFAQSLVLGPLAISLFLVWEYRREKRPFPDLLKAECYLLASYAATVAAFISYFAYRVGLRRLFYDTVTFVAKYFSTYEPGGWKTYVTGWPSVHNPANWPDLAAWPLVHFLIPLVYILFFVRYWRERRLRPEIPWERLMLINITGISLFLTIASGPSWNRMYTISLPAMIMLIWFLHFPFKLERLLTGALWVLVLALLIVRPIVTQTRWRALLDLPTGRTAFLDPGIYQETRWVQERTHPGDYFFGDQVLGFALRLRNPSRLAYVTPYAFTRPEEVLNVVQGLETQRVGFVSWYPGLDVSVDPVGNSLSPLRRYLAQNYRVAVQFSDGHTIWERIDRISE